VVVVAAAVFVDGLVDVVAMAAWEVSWPPFQRGDHYDGGYVAAAVENDDGMAHFSH